MPEKSSAGGAVGGGSAMPPVSSLLFRLWYHLVARSHVDVKNKGTVFGVAYFRGPEQNNIEKEKKNTKIKA